MRFRKIAVIVLVVMAAAPGVFAQAKEALKPEDPAFKGMRYRLIGPFRGGRSIAVAGVPGDPDTYYFGAAGGGVWKTTDASVSWTPLFDREAAFSIGAIAVAPSDPNVIYVGTGETALRGDIAQGDGVYQSLDAGKTWKNVGLRDTRAIGKILIHPRNPDIVLVAALGHPFGPNAERGVFRSADGGLAWTPPTTQPANLHISSPAASGPSLLDARTVRRGAPDPRDSGGASGAQRLGESWRRRWQCEPVT